MNFCQLAGKSVKVYTGTVKPKSTRRGFIKKSVGLPPIKKIGNVSSFTFRPNYCFSKVNILLDFRWVGLDAHCHMVTISVCLINEANGLLIVLYVCESFISECNMNKSRSKIAHLKNVLFILQIKKNYPERVVMYMLHSNWCLPQITITEIPTAAYSFDLGLVFCFVFKLHIILKSN